MLGKNLVFLIIWNLSFHFSIYGNSRYIPLKKPTLNGNIQQNYCFWILNLKLSFFHFSIYDEIPDAKVSSNGAKEIFKSQLEQINSSVRNSRNKIEQSFKEQQGIYIFFSNCSYRFLNPNYFFRFEFELFQCIQS